MCGHEFGKDDSQSEEADLFTVKKCVAAAGFNGFAMVYRILQ